MSIKIAKNSGFCFGVKRAIKIAEEAANKNHEIVTLGPIIHNPQMVERLEKQGIINVDEINEIHGRPTIIRSHGVKKVILETLKSKGVEIINATCPYVSKAQEQARNLSEQGYFVIIMGDKDHPEVIAIQSYVKGEVLVVANVSEIGDKYFKKIGVISQTTKNIVDFQNLVKELTGRCNEMLVINTICTATNLRQNSTLKLAKDSDLMIVVGGKNSSNTKMLAKISKKYIKTYHIETSGELQKNWFKKGMKIGLTAGASTPDWVIVEVYNKIIECMGNITLHVNKVENIPGFKEDMNV